MQYYLSYKASSSFFQPLINSIIHSFCAAQAKIKRNVFATFFNDAPFLLVTAWWYIAFLDKRTIQHINNFSIRTVVQYRCRAPANFLGIKWRSACKLVHATLHRPHLHLKVSQIRLFKLMYPRSLPCCEIIFYLVTHRVRRGISPSVTLWRHSGSRGRSLSRNCKGHFTLLINL